jgi:aspartate kinase
MGKTTDMLTENFLKASGKKNPSQELDDVLSMGERTSARIFTAALKAYGVDARYFDPSDSDWPIITDDRFGNAKPILEECSPRIKHTVLQTLERGIVPVIPGFIGRTLKGDVTTLGRGGSDVTAFILARAMKPMHVVIVTDVDGIMTADPKIVSNPKRVESIDVRKLVNLCDSGDKFIRRRALKFLDGSFSVRVVGNHKNELDSGGTVVNGCLPKTPIYLGHDSPVCSIVVVGAELSNEPKILSKIFREIDRYKIPILAQSADADTACIYLPEGRANDIAEAFHSAIIENGRGFGMAIRRNLAFLRIVAVESENTSEVLNRIIGSLKAKGIGIIGAHTVASNILIFVEWAEKDAALSSVRKVCKAL